VVAAAPRPSSAARSWAAGTAVYLAILSIGQSLNRSSFSFGLTSSRLATLDALRAFSSAVKYACGFASNALGT